MTVYYLPVATFHMVIENHFSKQLLAAGRNVCFKSKLSVADSRVSWTYRKVPSYIAHKSLIMWISEIDCGRKDGLREKLMRAED